MTKRNIRSLGKITKKPLWLKELDKEAPYGDFINGILNPRTKGLIDHHSYRCINYRGEKIEFLIVQPYNAYREQFKWLETICKEYGLDFIIDGISDYKPGDTFRILICKKFEG